MMLLECLKFSDLELFCGLEHTLTFHHPSMTKRIAMNDANSVYRVHRQTWKFV